MLSGLPDCEPEVESACHHDSNGNGNEGPPDAETERPLRCGALSYPFPFVFADLGRHSPGNVVEGRGQVGGFGNGSGYGIVVAVTGYGRIPQRLGSENMSEPIDGGNGYLGDVEEGEVIGDRGSST